MPCDNPTCAVSHDPPVYIAWSEDDRRRHHELQKLEIMTKNSYRYHYDDGFCAGFACAFGLALGLATLVGIFLLIAL